VAICFSETIALALDEAMPTMTHAADADYIFCSSFKQKTPLPQLQCALATKKDRHLLRNS
jgi:hypothetical protein